MDKVWTMKFIGYETYGNRKDGYEVDNLYEMCELTTTHDLEAMSNKQIAKLFHNKLFIGLFSSTPIIIDYRRIEVEDFWPFLEIVNKHGRPEARIEITEGVNQ